MRVLRHTDGAGVIVGVLQRADASISGTGASPWRQDALIACGSWLVLLDLRTVRARPRASVVLAAVSQLNFSATDFALAALTQSEPSLARSTSLRGPSGVLDSWGRFSRAWCVAGGVTDACTWDADGRQLLGVTACGDGVVRLKPVFEAEVDAIGCDPFCCGALFGPCTRTNLSPADFAVKSERPGLAHPATCSQACQLCARMLRLLDALLYFWAGRRSVGPLTWRSKQLLPMSELCANCLWRAPHARRGQVAYCSRAPP